MKELLVRPYVAAVGAYLHYAKLPLSHLTARFEHASKALLPTFESLDEYVRWMGEHLRWRSDGFGGVWDVFPSLAGMLWQLEQQGIAEDDCDGLAFFSAQVVKAFADNEQDVYIVTLVLDPRHLPLERAAHVVCVFRSGGAWRVISNTELYPRRYTTFAAALSENPYARGQEIRLVEVRDSELRRVPAPVD